MPGKALDFKAFLPRTTGSCGPTVFDELDFSHLSITISPHIPTMRGKVMPIYEFYCPQCNTIYNFFSRRVDTETIPSCPTCKTVPLTRQMSVFARITRGREEPSEDDMPPIDESRMEKAMNMLAGEMDGIDEEDPRQAVRLMRKLSDLTGLQLGDGMEEALSRMERGEDPEQIEQEMGDLLDSEDPFTLAQKTTRGTSRRAQPRVDETLYDL